MVNDAAPTHAELLDIWHEALESVATIAEGLDPEQWELPTACPGWSVADVVAHVIDLEQLFGGEARPDHEPDWASLPHADDDFSRMVEVGIDFRRGRSPEELTSELRETIARRRAQLDALPDDAEVLGPTGGMMPVDRYLRTRTFDTWVHEQDIRWAVGDDGGWNSAPAAIAFQQMWGAVPYMWGKNIKAPAGSVLFMLVIGPDLHREIYVTVDENGKGTRIAETAQPDVTAEMTWAAFMRLACGRVDLNDPWLKDKIEITGEPELAARLMPGMNIAP